MTQSDVDKIKERLGIEEVIGSYITVEKSGRNLKARCPFHNEKTPSFFISPDRGTYYCFGCGVKGDIFSFVQNFEGLDFSGALKILADRAGVQISHSKSDQDNNDKLFEIMETAAGYYVENLKNNSAVIKYLTDRGLTEETISKWKIGFAKDEWQGVNDFLLSKKISSKDIEKVGLIKQRESGSGFYDRFRNRIMFPIFDSSGRVIAFSGRIFASDSKEAKYINSPETVLFVKSNILFGYNFAKTLIRRHDFSILVEGQMDTIMCHQAGYANAVASSGTALTQEQLNVLQKISKRLVIAYDADGAGFRASEKAWQIALSLGMDVKIAKMDKGDDPAELIKKDIKKWKEVIKNSVHIIDFLSDNILESEQDERKKIVRLAREVVPQLSSIKSDVEKSYFVKRIATKFNIDEESVRKESGNLKESNLTSQKPVISQNTINQKDKISSKSGDERSHERMLAGIYFSVSSKNDLALMEKIEKGMTEVGGADCMRNLIDEFTPFKDELIFATESFFENPAFLKRSVDELLGFIKIKRLKEVRNLLKQKLMRAEMSGDEHEINLTLREIDSVSKDIAKSN